jgi:hypothetical protein
MALSQSYLVICTEPSKALQTRPKLDFCGSIISCHSFISIFFSKKLTLSDKLTPEGCSGQVAPTLIEQALFHVYKFWKTTEDCLVFMILSE